MSVNSGIALVDFAFAAAFSIVYDMKLEKLLRTWTVLFYEIFRSKLLKNKALSLAYFPDSKVKTLSRN